MADFDLIRSLAQKAPTKIVLLVMDGVGDIALPNQGTMTPLEAADSPHLDRLARVPINPNPLNAEWIDGNVLQSKLIHKVDPEYPELAKRARVQGKVNLAVTVNEEGHVSNVEVIGGHPMLLIAAEKAVKQWKYQPTLLNGKAIPVVAFVRVDFVLPADTETDATAGELLDPNAMVISLDESGQVSMDKEPVPVENLGRELQKIFRERPDKTLFLRVPANVNFSDVKRIVDIAKGAGADEIGLVTVKNR